MPFGCEPYKLLLSLGVAKYKRVTSDRSRMGWHRFFLVLVPVLSCSFLAGCVIPGGLHQPTLSHMRESISEAVPLGTSTTVAQNVMQANGYRCRLTDDALACESFGSLPYEVFTREWAARFTLQGGVVTDEQVSTSLNAP